MLPHTVNNLSQIFLNFFKFFYLSTFFVDKYGGYPQNLALYPHYSPF